MARPDEDGAVDQLLRAAGASWREGQPPPPEPQWRDTGAVTSITRALPSAFLALAAVALVAAIVAVVVIARPNTNGAAGLQSPLPSAAALAIASASPSPTTMPSTVPSNSGRPPGSPIPSISTPTAMPTASPAATNALTDLVVGTDDAVSAIGTVSRVDGTLYICGATGHFATLGVSHRCWGVPITGIDPATLPGWSEGEGTSGHLTIRGTWDGQRIVVTHVDPVSHDAFSLQLPGPLPCSAPPEGWQPGGPDEPALHRLSDEVTSHTDLYSAEQRYEVPSASGGSSSSVFWVGTVGDVAAVRNRLTAIFPYNLCVTQDPYSRATLNALEDRLLGLVDQEDWEPTVDPSGSDRVWVRLLILDANAAQLLEADAAKLELDPLVQKAAP